MRIPLLVAAAAAVSFAVPATAQDTPENREVCVNQDDDYASTDVVTACTAWIQSGTMASAKLAVVFQSRGTAYAEQHDYRRAIADFSEPIRLDPLQEIYFVKRGATYWFQKDYGHAITDFSEAIRLDPKDADALWGRGVAEQQLGRKAEGDADIARARAIDPNVGK